MQDSARSPISSLGRSQSDRLPGAELWRKLVRRARTIFALSAFCLLPGLALVADHPDGSLGVRSNAALPPAATFSILAVDRKTREVGVATQSKIVAVGAIVPYAASGAGAVASQAYANSSYGPGAIRLLSDGVPPQETIDDLVSEDARRAQRQLAVISPSGDRAVFTGDDCLPWAGSLEGEDCLAAGNLLTGPEVLEAMIRVFESTEGPLEERLLVALLAGDEAGGDRRGRQSAAILVVRDGWGYGGIGDRYRDLRVDDSETPIEDLIDIHRKHRELFPRPVPEDR